MDEETKALEFFPGIDSGLTQDSQVFPTHRRSHSVGPGIEIRDDWSERRRRDGQLEDLTSME